MATIMPRSLSSACSRSRLNAGSLNGDAVTADGSSPDMLTDVPSSLELIGDRRSCCSHAFFGVPSGSGTEKSRRRRMLGSEALDARLVRRDDTRSSVTRFFTDRTSSCRSLETTWPSLIPRDKLPLLRDVQPRGELKPLDGDGEEAVIPWLFASELEL
jgi:hypothetical protein